jgi:hypothetical protein
MTYGGETWTLTLTDENALRIFERKILRKIYGPVLENGEFRIRYNEELNELIKGEDIVRFRSRDNSVGIATGYGLDDQVGGGGAGVRVPVW